MVSAVLVVSSFTTGTGLAAWLTAEGFVTGALGLRLADVSVAHVSACLFSAALDQRRPQRQNTRDAAPACCAVAGLLTECVGPHACCCRADAGNERRCTHACLARERPCLTDMPPANKVAQKSLVRLRQSGLRASRDLDLLCRLRSVLKALYTPCRASCRGQRGPRHGVRLPGDQS